MKKEPLTEEKNTFTSQIYTSQNKLYLKTHSNLNYKQEIILATQDKKNHSDPKKTPFECSFLL